MGMKHGLFNTDWMSLRRESLHRGGKTWQIIVIGSTVLCGPWPSSEASASHRPAVASSVFVTFFRMGPSTPRPTPAILENQCFLSGLSRQSVGRSQFESVRNSLFALAWLSRKNVAQESRRGHACIRLGRHKWHYPRFDSTHSPVRCVLSGPHTTALTPRRNRTLSRIV
jgi:hypothetical protein